jgi:hypothetical protein
MSYTKEIVPYAQGKKLTLGDRLITDADVDTIVDDKGMRVWVTKEKDIFIAWPERKKPVSRDESGWDMPMMDLLAKRAKSFKGT